MGLTMGSGDFTKEDRERLVRVEDAAEMIKAFMVTAASDTGFPRCAARGEVLKGIEKHQKKVDSFMTWFYRGLVGFMGVWLLDIFLTHWHTIMQHMEELP